MPTSVRFVLALGLVAISMALAMAITKEERDNEFSKVAKDCKRIGRSYAINEQKLVRSFATEYGLNPACKTLLDGIISGYEDENPKSKVEHAKKDYDAYRKAHRNS